MKRLAIAVASIACTLVAGCAAVPSAKVQARLAELVRTTPICVDESDCNAKWETAQLWVVHNAAYKIRTATNVVIETFTPDHSETSIAVRITREPAGGGKYKLIIAVWCDNLFGCFPNQWDALLDFNRTVGTVNELLRARPPVSLALSLQPASN